MATIKQLVDDFDEKTGKTVKQHTFKIDGQMYYVDLSDANWKNLVMEPLATVIGVSRAAGTSGSGATINVGDEEYDTEEVRAWARDHNYDVKDRGRISASVVSAFAAAKESEQEQPQNA
jgi:hypothetical protein